MSSFLYTPPQAVLVTAVLAYLLGSIPFGFILLRRFRGQDVRQTGSGNIGATNVARSSIKLGIVTLILDVLKGLAAVTLARILFPHDLPAAAVAALFAMLGHMFPVWLGFRGGKGVATGLGSFVLIFPRSVLFAVAIFVVVVFLFRYISLGSIVAVAFLPALAWWLEVAGPGLLFLLGIASLLIVLKHHANIRRLTAGTESKFEIHKVKVKDHP